MLSVLCIDYDKFAEWKDIIPFYKTSERMALFYGRRLNGTMKETAIKKHFIFKGFSYTANKKFAVRAIQWKS